MSNFDEKFDGILLTLVTFVFDVSPFNVALVKKYACSGGKRYIMILFVCSASPKEDNIFFADVKTVQLIPFLTELLVSNVSISLCVYIRV